MARGFITAVFLSMCGWNRKVRNHAFFLWMIFLAGGAGTHFALAQSEDITLTASFVGGGNSLDFGRLRNLQEDGSPAAESSTRQVRLAIQPATGVVRPYLVTQILSSEVTQESGGAAPTDSILFRVEEESGSGDIRVPNETPLTVGEQELYRSAPAGGASQLLITYDLTASPDQEAGSYHGVIDYRVSLI